ncbi:hypothetical protein PSCICM_12620 [Pseudomonas cichorii]|uniref:Uncharacterized protein n=1 Tax=Pseudomonas cichorii TaxID=36746 RepID=A0ABQ1DHG5_PSECI|nr:hypothetical protein PSCICM_12620 [Pseudomonas cichorii]GFM90456.1 hypothetical protein PSCICP_04280 [Pseudomonas cichorii]
MLLANEQLDAQVEFQLLDARGQVRGHPMDVLRSGADAALLGDSLEYFKLDEIQFILQT